MSQASEFDRLERYVSKLLEKHEQLLEKHAQLQQRVQQREDEIQELKGKVSSADSERGDISNRIKGLIDQIEEWESALEESEESSGASSVVEEEESYGVDRGAVESDVAAVVEEEGGDSGDEFQTEENNTRTEDKETAQQHLFNVDPWGRDSGR